MEVDTQRGRRTREDRDGRRGSVYKPRDAQEASKQQKLEKAWKAPPPERPGPQHPFTPDCWPPELGEAQPPWFAATRFGVTRPSGPRQRTQPRPVFSSAPRDGHGVGAEVTPAATSSHRSSCRAGVLPGGSDFPSKASTVPGAQRQPRTAKEDKCQVGRLQTGTVHLAEPARESVVFGLP